LCHLQAATTWQELEAAVYQKQGLLALQQQQQQDNEDGEQQPQQQQQQAVSGSPMEVDAQQPQQQQQQVPQQTSTQLDTPALQQQQQQAAPATRKQRRKQPVPMLNVSTSSILSGLPGARAEPVSPAPPPPAAAAATEAKSNPAAGGSSGVGGSSGASSSASTQPLRRAQDPVKTQPTTQKPALPFQQQQQQEPDLNALHVTGAFQKLPELLPQQPSQLQGSNRRRVAALITHLSACALGHAQNLALDPQGLAHVLLGLSKLGHRDHRLLDALQVAALVKVQEFSPRDVAMVLMAFAGLGVR
jgi:hypothetical protein